MVPHAVFCDSVRVLDNGVWPGRGYVMGMNTFIFHISLVRASVPYP